VGAESWWHAATVVALALALVEGVLLLGLARAVAPLLAARGGDRSAEWGLPVGTTAPALRLAGRGSDVPEPVVLAGRDHIVLFLTPSCSGCVAVAPVIQPVIEEGGRSWEVLALLCGNRERAEAFAAQRIDPGVRVLFDPDGAAEAAFQTKRAYPLGFAVASDGVVRARGPAGRWEAVRQLAADAPPIEQRVPVSVASESAAAGLSVAEG